MNIQKLLRKIEQAGGEPTVGEGKQTAPNQHVMYVNILGVPTDNGLVRPYEQVKMTVMNFGSTDVDLPETATFWTLPSILRDVPLEPVPVGTEEEILLAVTNTFSVKLLDHSIRNTRRGAIVSGITTADGATFTQSEYIVSLENSVLVAYKQEMKVV